MIGLQQQQFSLVPLGFTSLAVAATRCFFPAHALAGGGSLGSRSHGGVATARETSGEGARGRVCYPLRSAPSFERRAGEGTRRVDMHRL